jgi:maleylpyruvate isomerase
METVASIDDEAASRATLLNGWSVAMLVAHLARNADSHTWVAEGARLGERRRRYRDQEERNAGIEAGRGRSARELVDDLRGSIDQLEAAWDSLPTEAWAIVAQSANGEPEPMVDLPRYRWRETEIHHVDLGLGFTADDWDISFVDTELQLWLASLDERLPPDVRASITAVDSGRTWTIGKGSKTLRVEGSSPMVLAWLVGRQADGFPQIGPWQW